jgi:hypothetical protein
VRVCVAHSANDFYVGNPTLNPASNQLNTLPNNFLYIYMDTNPDLRSSTPLPSGDWAYVKDCHAILHTAGCVFCDPWREHYNSSQARGAPSLEDACEMYRERLVEHLISELGSIEDERDRAVEQSAELRLELESVQKEIKDVEQDLVRLENTTHQLQQDLADDIETTISRLRRRVQDVHPPDDRLSRPLKYRRISPTLTDPSIPLRRAAPQSAEQRARDTDDVPFISPPSTSTASGPQANVPGTSSGVVFK